VNAVVQKSGFVKALVKKSQAEVERRKYAKANFQQLSGQLGLTEITHAALT